jgi:CelD/BcsL family acetyltransferase involved in cellulose biosynthesis
MNLAELGEPGSPGPGTVTLTARSWSSDEFAASREAWETLLARSDADPLFMSWEWQERWWRYHAQAVDATLRLIAVYAGPRLVGLAPFYSHPVVVRGVLRAHRLELIGNAWRHPRATFSDYLDIIAERNSRDAVRDALAEWLNKQPFWTELVICCTRRDGIASALVRSWLCRSAGGFVREVDAMNSWRATLPPSFGQYLDSLTSNVRRKLFHQRRKLVGLEIQYAGEDAVSEFLQELGRYSMQRWSNGGDSLRACELRFLTDFALCMARGGRLRLSRLRSAGRTLSVMYNVRVGDTEYFLQSGFDAAGAPGVSPGYLHFGYALEAACKENASQFDFLAGPGRHREYKRDFNAKPVAVVTYHVLRGGLTARLYAAHEMLTKLVGLKS